VSFVRFRAPLHQEIANFTGLRVETVIRVFENGATKLTSPITNILLKK
jgi:hypothetical protein